MTNEEKQLLFKDICARLPYGVKAICDVSPNEMFDELRKNNGRECFIDINSINGDKIEFRDEEGYVDWWMPICYIRPYLRPMSTMTEEEYEESCCVNEWTHLEDGTEVPCMAYIDWLNAHHFDYRGLIEKGLAIEAPDGMYNKEESEKESEIPIPKTIDEAISTLEKILSDEDREYLLKNGAISMHDSLGRWIRNEWGLWTGSELKDELMNMNKGLNHPDDMSNYIIEEFIKYWNNKL